MSVGIIFISYVLQERYRPFLDPTARGDIKEHHGRSFFTAGVKLVYVSTDFKLEFAHST